MTIAQYHLFVGRENCTTLIVKCQRFAAAGSDWFLGNIKSRSGCGTQRTQRWEYTLPPTPYVSHDPQ